MLLIRHNGSFHTAWASLLGFTIQLTIADNDSHFFQYNAAHIDAGPALDAPLPRCCNSYERGITDIGPRCLGATG